MDRAKFGCVSATKVMSTYSTYREPNALVEVAHSCRAVAAGWPGNEVWQGSRRGIGTRMARQIL